MDRRRKTSTRVYDLTIKLQGQSVPIRLFTEHRRGWRIAMADKAIHLRIPNRKGLGPAGDPLVWARKWLVKKYEEQPQLFQRYSSKFPVSGTIYDTVYGRFTLEVKPTNRKTARGEIRSDQIMILFPETWRKREQMVELPKVISRTFAKAFQVPFEKEVERLNLVHFNFRYKKISLRFNQSTWGSCTTTGNLNFSTRLFLAPPSVMRYVIIHELAHLGQHNHSRRFWKLIERAMPSYRSKVSWLKENGATLNF